MGQAWPDDQSELEQLRAENKRLSAELDDMVWAKEKTNEGIRILYKDLERKNNELKTLDQLKSKFLAVVSHELRTPITIVLQTVENIADGAFGEINDKQKLWLKRIEENAGRLGNLVNDILDFSRLQARSVPMKRERIRVDRIVASAVDNMAMLARQKDVSLIAAIDAPLPKIWANGPRIEQVVVNLIANAIKFTPAGGRVEVRASAASDSCQVAVVDTGPGISEEDLKMIFDPFVQAVNDGSKAPLTSGVGLGLAICKEIVDQHQGKIWVESELGKGSRFFFSLPNDIRAGGNGNDTNTDR